MTEGNQRTAIEQEMRHSKAAMRAAHALRGGDVKGYPGSTQVQTSERVVRATCDAPRDHHTERSMSRSQLMTPFRRGRGRAVHQKRSHAPPSSTVRSPRWAGA